MKLKEYLSHYNELTVPDDFYYAWRILYTGYKCKDKRAILEQAEKDLTELENQRRQSLFNKGRSTLEDLHRGDPKKRNSLGWRETRG